MTEISAEATLEKPLSFFENRLLGNLYHSYHLSQGDTQLQAMLLWYTTQTYDDLDIQELLQTKDGNNRVANVVKRLRLPTNHSPILNRTPNTVHLEFERGYQQQTNLLKYRNGELPQVYDGKLDRKFRDALSYSPEELEIHIASHMLSRDVAFITSERGRPSRTPEEKRRESFVKKYVQDGHSTKSEDYDHLMLRIRPFFYELNNADHPTHFYLPYSLKNQAEEIYTDYRLLQAALASIDSDLPSHDQA